MSILFQNPSRTTVLAWVTLAPVLLAYGPAQARGKTKVNYVPGITLTPDVFENDGATARLYPTPTAPGTTLWKEGLPIQQGDKVKLNVFVATGGADLKEIKVKLDNNPLADRTSSPWNTVIDTSTLSAGTHMVDVWAQASGDPPQASEKQLSFFVIKQLVKGDLTTHSGGGTIETTPPVNADVPPTLPAYLAGKTIDANATVAVRARAASLPVTSSSIPVGDSTVMVSEPEIFLASPAKGSTATKFAYGLVRDGQTILTSDAAYNMDDPTRITEIKIQGRTDISPGLRPGLVALWVWGVDAQGNPGNPRKIQLQIPD